MKGLKKRKVVLKKRTLDLKKRKVDSIKRKLDLNKRKLDQKEENSDSVSVSIEEIRSLLQPLDKTQLVDLLAKLGSQNPSVAEEIKSIANADPVHRKLLVRGLALNTTSETLRAAFQEHGEIEEVDVLFNRRTGECCGYGFITYKNIESTQLALRAPSKLIDGKLAVCNLACEGISAVSSAPDLGQRKLYIANLSPEVTNEMLLDYFRRHGEIEEASVACHKNTTESRGFGFVTYKTAEAAKKALYDPAKTLGGRNIYVKYADSNTDKASQPSFPTGVVPTAAVPMNPGYVQPGRAHVSSGPLPLPINYTYPQTVAPPYLAPYPRPSTAPAPYPRPPTAPAPYSRLPTAPAPYSWPLIAPAPYSGPPTAPASYSGPLIAHAPYSGPPTAPASYPRPLTAPAPYSEPPTAPASYPTPRPAWYLHY